MRSIAIALGIIPGAIVAGLLYSAVTKSAAAEAEELNRAAAASAASGAQDVMVLHNTRELDYPVVDVKTEGAVTKRTLRNERLILGLRVFKRPDGSCYKTDVTLIKMHVVKSGDESFEAPVTRTDKAPVDCPI